MNLSPDAGRPSYPPSRSLSLLPRPGFDVMGVWPPNSDGTDVNAVDRSPSGRFLISGDDFGKVEHAHRHCMLDGFPEEDLPLLSSSQVKLFNYPVVVHHAPSLVYGGHSSFVPNVRSVGSRLGLVRHLSVRPFLRSHQAQASSLPLPLEFPRNRWSADETYACSVGGRDRCTFQFRLVMDRAPPPPKVRSVGTFPLSLIYVARTRTPDGFTHALMTLAALPYRIAQSYGFTPLDKEGIAWGDPGVRGSPGAGANRAPLQGGREAAAAQRRPLSAFR